VKLTPLLFCVPVPTNTLPLVAPTGTTAAMLVLLQLKVVAVPPPVNVTVLVPLVGPKLVPVSVTAVPAAPEVGARLVSPGATIVKFTPFVTWLPIVTVTFPVIALLGTETTMLVSLQLLTVAIGVPNPRAPLNATVLAPWVAPKLVPAMVTTEFTGPEFGDRLVITGVTVNAIPLLATPPAAVTTTLPEGAPPGTVAVILVSLHVWMLADVPPNVTPPLPWVAPKAVPAITTDTPTAPLVGVRLLMLGAALTVNAMPLLAMPPAAVTTTLPVVAPAGTVAVMLLALQLLMVAVVPLNFTLPLPCDEPKFEPAMTMAEPTAPLFGVRLLMLGAAVTVNVTPLLATPPAAVTTTLPVVAPVGTVAVMLVALQLEIVAVVPLNFTLPLPWDEPKFEPAMTIADPTAPVFGATLLMLGAAVTVNVTPLLATPPAAVTATLPVVAPVGTVAVMLVAFQLEIVAVVPLNFTLPLPWDEPKFEPAMTIADPTPPVFGVRLLMLGAAVTVNVTPLLPLPLTFTTTFPVTAPAGTVAVMLVELKLVIVAVLLLLNSTVTFAWFVPKLEPAITIDEPTAPLFGVKLLIVGAAAAKSGNNSRKNAATITRRKYAISPPDRERTLRHRFIGNQCPRQLTSANLFSVAQQLPCTRDPRCHRS
jgi:hypothetical protein